MKIFLLNVDAFKKSHAEKIISAIENEEPAPDVIVFQEFIVDAPAGVNALAEKTAIKLFRERGYEPVYPDGESTISGRYFITMMFVKQKLLEQIESCPSPIIMVGGERRLQWRWCEAKIGDITIVGIHAPLVGKRYTKEVVDAFFNSLKEYAARNSKKKTIILGDFNIATNSSRVQNRINSMCSVLNGKALTDWTKRDRKVILECTEFFERLTVYTDLVRAGYSDAVQGDSITFFPKATTIDHILVSESLTKNVRSVKVFTQKELELSDHAVIIVDIDIQA